MPNGPKLTVPVGKRDHAQGQDDAPVTLVEYGDYECSHCGEAYPIIKEVQRRLGRTLRFVFRNFPLTESHPHALHAAEAAEAAAAQGKFWEMHDVLYENQEALSDEDLQQYADAVDLDLEQFDEDMNEKKYLPRVQEDFSSGIRSGVNGTPTFFINGFRFDGMWDVDGLVTALREAMPKAPARSAKRTKTDPTAARAQRNPARRKTASKTGTRKSPARK